MPETMRALLLTAKETLQLGEIPLPTVRPGQLLVRPRAIGVCGTDFHIYLGQANYHSDAQGRPIPFEQSPQILGHEIEAVVAEAAGEFRAGDRVIVDQGWNCRSQNRTPVCDYCATGDSHQCEYYLEQGITGLPGGLSEYLAVPLCNAIAIAQPLAPGLGALAETLACVLHSSRRMEAASARYAWHGDRPIRSVLICGAGPTGLLFLQYLRRVLGFQGQVLVAEPNPAKHELIHRWQGRVLTTSPEAWVAEVRQLTQGRGVEYLIDCAGYGPLYRDVPGFMCKQGTLLLFGHGHDHASLGLLNPIQFKEIYIVSGAGASGGWNAQGKPEVYAQALQWLCQGVIEAEPLITHRYAGLSQVTAAFTTDRFRTDYIKGLMVMEN